MGVPFASPTDLTSAVVICTRDRPAQLAQCLAAVSRGRVQPTEVVIVDNAPSDSVAREIAERFNATYVEEPRAGLSHARNAGALATRHDIVAYLDDDALPDPEWLAALLGEFHDPRVVVVTGRCLPTAAATGAGERMLPWFFESVERAELHRSMPGWAQHALRGLVGAGMNMAFRRSAFESRPGFDVRLGRGAAIAGYEEHEAIFALLQRGGRAVYTPDALVTHPAPESTDAFERFVRRTRSSYVAYLLLMFTKHPDARAALLTLLKERLRRRAGAARGNEPFPLSRVAMLRAAAGGTFAFLRSSRL